MLNAAIFFAEGLEEIEGLTVVDLLRRAGIPIQMVSMTDSLTVTGSHQIPIVTDCLFETLKTEEINLLILPGGMPGTKNLMSHTGLKNYLMQAAKQNLYIAAICAAPSVLGQFGLLKGKQATCYPGYEDQLTDAIYLKKPVVIDDHIITSRGLGTAIEFACALIAIDQGTQKAEQIKQAIIYTR